MTFQERTAQTTTRSILFLTCLVILNSTETITAAPRTQAEPKPVETQSPSVDPEQIEIEPDGFRIATDPEQIEIEPDGYRIATDPEQIEIEPDGYRIATDPEQIEIEPDGYRIATDPEQIEIEPDGYRIARA